MNRALCIYHGNCADGFGAAWVVKKAFSSEVDFHAGVYQNQPPDVSGHDVVLVDFSYKRPVMEKMIKEALSVTIIDHHKSAAEDLAGLSGRYYEANFNMDKSGAMMTWEYMFPALKPPALLQHIEDRDLWRFVLPYTREIQAAVFSYPYDFDVWDSLMDMPLETLVSQGRAIERKHHKDIAELLAVTARRMVIGGHNVPVANLPYTFSSDAGHVMGKGEPFAACYYDVPDGRVFSLRSEDSGEDVSAIAKLNGGGGHAHAAGFKVPFHVALGFEVS